MVEVGRRRARTLVGLQEPAPCHDTISMSLSLHRMGRSVLNRVSMLSTGAIGRLNSGGYLRKPFMIIKYATLPSTCGSSVSEINEMYSNMAQSTGLLGLP